MDHRFIVSGKQALLLALMAAFACQKSAFTTHDKKLKPAHGEKTNKKRWPLRQKVLFISLSITCGGILIAVPLYLSSRHKSVDDKHNRHGSQAGLLDSWNKKRTEKWGHATFSYDCPDEKSLEKGCWFFRACNKSHTDETQLPAPYFRDEHVEWWLKFDEHSRTWTWESEISHTEQRTDKLFFDQYRCNLPQEVQDFMKTVEEGTFKAHELLPSEILETLLEQATKAEQRESTAKPIQCCIDLEDYSEGSVMYKCLGCKKIAGCRDCIVKLVGTRCGKPQCPLCRSTEEGFAKVTIAQIEGSS